MIARQSSQFLRLDLGKIVQLIDVDLIEGGALPSIDHVIELFRQQPDRFEHFDVLLVESSTIRFSSRSRSTDFFQRRQIFRERHVQLEDTIGLLDPLFIGFDRFDLLFDLFALLQSHSDRNFRLVRTGDVKRFLQRLDLL